MFGFGKKSKIELAKKINELSINAAEQFLNYLKEDVIIYDKCINENPIKNTSVIFIINIYRDILNSKYASKDVFSVIYTSVTSLASNKTTEELFMNTLMEYINACNQSVEYYKGLPNFDIATVLTKVYFSLVLDDREYVQNQLEGEILETISYKKIYNYISGILKNTTILNEDYNLNFF